MITDPKTTSRPIPNRVTAIAVHTRMRADGASHYELGFFYKTMLKRRLWSSQSHLAESLGVSVSNVSRVMALTRIPKEVVEAVGGAEKISFRIGGLLLDAIDKTGEATFISRVREAVRAGYATVDDILEFAVLDRIPERTPNKVRVRLTRDKKSLRLNIPDLDCFLPNLSRLEAFISRCFIMFDAELANHTAAAVESARRRLRTDAPCPEVRTRNFKPPLED